MTTDAQISDEEIRDWARGTGRQVGAKGRIAATLRAEYEQLAAEAAAAPPADPAPGPAHGSQSEPKPPEAAREETQPRRGPSAGSRPRSKLWGGSGRPAAPRRPARRPPGAP